MPSEKELDAASLALSKRENFLYARQLASAALIAAERVRADDPNSEWNTAINAAANIAKGVPVYVDVDENPDEQREAISVRFDIVNAIKRLLR